jgi:MoaA/NifB/PqqE/SkfB family radical SAM enzyme
MPGPTLRRSFAHRAIRAGSVLLGAAGGVDSRPRTGPVYAQLGIADPCNHQCVMCPYHPPTSASAPVDGVQTAKFGGRKGGLMPLARFQAVVAELGALGTQRIDIVGRGEPLLHPDIVAMVASARQLGLEVGITTNGSRLSAKLAAGLVSAGLNQLKVSLNAGLAQTYPKIHVTETPAQFRSVLQNVQTMTQESRRLPGGGPSVTLSFVLLTANVAEVGEMVQRAVETGAHAVYLQHLLPRDDQADLTLNPAALTQLLCDLPRAAALAKQHGLASNFPSFATETRQLLRPTATTSPIPCYVGYYFTTIIGNGEVLPCCQTDQSVGSVAEAPFAEVWASPPYQAFRAAARNLPQPAPELATAECDRCYFRPHNRTVGRVLHPLDLSLARGGVSFGLSQLRRLVRLDD